LARRNSDQTNNARMRFQQDNGTFTKVLVQSDQDTIVLMSEAQDLTVTRVG